MKCDIIIPVWNQLKLTRECIDSIVRYTRFPYRLIVIDNGSQRQTREYLEELTSNNEIPVNLIRNETNLGYVKAVNQGLRASCGDYICLLNNDTKVQEGWLEELINVAQSNPKIGIVNPVDSPPSYKKELREKWIEIGFATGFCMLIKREVIDKIGFFDEDYEVGFWEDTDYCQRAKRAGYICAVAKASYVYHHPHQTFNFFEQDKINRIFEKNRELFYSKWGKILRIACIIFERDIDDKEINEILKLARKGHMIHLFLKSSARVKTDIEHGNIREFRYPDIFFNLFITIKILQRQKKKKRFDNVVTDNSKFAHRLQFFMPHLQIGLI